MLYLAIPAYNEVATIGVLLWRLRTVLAEFPREYEVVVYDDASTDETATVAEQYERAMPVRVLRGAQHLGYAGAAEALLRHIAGATRYPRRDAVLLMQADFTDPPVLVPEFARRFEGGADLVVGERTVVADAPVAVRRLFRAAHWAMRPFVRVHDVRDLTASMRLVRIAALRDALRAAGSEPFLRGDSWTANTDLLLRVAPHARRVESVPMEPTYGVRMRETRRVAMRDGLAALKWAWGARSRKAVPGSEVESSDSDRRGERGGPRRRDDSARDGRRNERHQEPELSVERLREKVREREGTRGLDGAPPPETRRERQRAREREREPENRPESRSENRSGERSGERNGLRSSEGQGEPSGGRERGSGRAPRTERGDSPETPRERPPRAERTPRGRTRADNAEATGTEEPRTREPRPARTRGADEPNETRRPPRPEPREEPVRVPFDAALELDDPFAPPQPRRDRLELVLDRPVERPQPTEVPEVPGVPPDHAESDRSALEFAESPSDDGEEVEADEGTEGEGTEGEGQPRKRRRNRRSRRGRRRRSEEAGELGGEAADAGVAGAAGDTEGPDASPNQEARSRWADRPLEGAPVPTRPPVDDAADDDVSDLSDDLGDDLGQDFDEDSAVRPRRRGRRGRRGGARRSRSRRERGDGEGTGDGDAGGDGPEGSE